MFKRGVSVILCFVTACQEVASPQATDGTITDDPPRVDAQESGCTARVIAMTPPDGAQDVGCDVEPTVTFDAPVSADDPTWGIAIDGVPGAITLAPDGLSATYHPDTRLRPGDTFTLWAKVCDEVSTSTFTTREEPIDPSTLRDTAWTIDPAHVSWASPDSAPALLHLLTPPPMHMALTPSSAPYARPDELALTLWIESEACPPPVEIGVVDLSQNPRFVIPPRDVRIDGFGQPFEVMNVSVTGSFDGTSIRDLGVLATFDTRPLADALDLDLCAVSEGLGSPCTPCPDGARACMEVAAAYDLIPGEPAAPSACR